MNCSKCYNNPRKENSYLCERCHKNFLKKRAKNTVGHTAVNPNILAQHSSGGASGYGMENGSASNNE